MFDDTAPEVAGTNLFSPFGDFFAGTVFVAGTTLFSPFGDFVAGTMLFVIPFLFDIESVSSSSEEVDKYFNGETFFQLSIRLLGRLLFLFSCMT